MDAVLVDKALPEEEFILRVSIKHFVAEMMTELAEELEPIENPYDDLEHDLDFLGFLLASNLLVQARKESKRYNLSGDVVNLIEQLNIVLDSLEMDMTELGSSEFELNTIIARSYLNITGYWIGFFKRWPSNKWGEYMLLTMGVSYLVKALKTIKPVSSGQEITQIDKNLSTLSRDSDTIVTLDGPKAGEVIEIFSRTQEKTESLPNYPTHHPTPSFT